MGEKITNTQAVERLREVAAFLLSFVPEWATKIERGLPAMMYGTGTAEGDAKVVERVRLARAALADTTDLAPDDAPCADPAAHEPTQSVTVASGDPRIADSATATRASAAAPDDADALRAENARLRARIAELEAKSADF